MYQHYLNGSAWPASTPNGAHLLIFCSNPRESLTFPCGRLHANDRVDPYVALYEPPTASRVGNVVHLQWKGLLSPDFVQSMIDVIV